MKVEKGKITECTELELYEYWLTRGWDDIFSFPDYMRRCIENGTKILKSEEETGESESTSG